MGEQEYPFAEVLTLRRKVERLEADLEEAEQSHYIADLESRIAVVKECLSGIEWHGLTISVNHQSNVEAAILVLRDIVPTVESAAAKEQTGEAGSREQAGPPDNCPLCGKPHDLILDEDGNIHVATPASPSPGSASPVIIPECHKSVVMGQARHMLDPTSPDGGDAKETA